MGCVYFIEAVGADRVKIGYTDKDHPAPRLKNFVTSSPYPLKLLGFVRCENAADYEDVVHDLLNPDKLHNEWFEKAAALSVLSCAESLGGKWPGEVEYRAFCRKNGTVMEFDEWDRLPHFYSDVDRVVLAMLKVLLASSITRHGGASPLRERGLSLSECEAQLETKICELGQRSTENVLRFAFRCGEGRSDDEAASALEEYMRQRGLGRDIIDAALDEACALNALSPSRSWLERRTLRLAA